jgi:mRNA interferase MazF
MNTHLRTATVVPLTSGSRPAPFRVAVTFKGKSGLLHVDQMRTLDRVRLVKRMGRVDAVILRETLAVLREMFAP